MNTNVNARVSRQVEKSHRIIVGIVVALIAAAGISTVIVNANHRVIRHTASAAAPAPAVASPDALAPQAGEATQANPAPVTENPVAPAASTTQPSGTAPAATAAPPAASVTQPSAPGVRNGGRTDNAAGADQGAANVPATNKTAPDGESAVVTFNTKLDSTATAFGNGRLVASAAGPKGSSRDQAPASGADAANADRQITSAVQSQIAADSTTGRSALGVNTIDGIVILTGTVPAANVVDHVKQVVEQVQDVRGVDATAVQISTI